MAEHTESKGILVMTYTEEVGDGKIEIRLSNFTSGEMRIKIEQMLGKPTSETAGTWSQGLRWKCNDLPPL